MSNISESTVQNIKFPMILMNNEFIEFIQRNSFSSSEFGLCIVIEDGLSNQVSYLRETYGSDVLYKKA
jgi:hypothetical protein